MNNYLEKINKIDSNSALKIGILFSLIFTGLIFFADTYWFSQPDLLPRPEGVAFWYKWQLVIQHGSQGLQLGSCIWVIKEAFGG